MPRILCIGQAVQDFVFAVHELPATASKHRAHGFRSVGGGPAATAAVAIARLGGSAMLCARTGDDDIGGIIVSELERYGVDCTLVRRLAGCSSSLSAVLVDDAGERLIVNYLDGAMEPDAAWLPARLPARIDAVLVDTRWPDGALRGLELARDAGVPGILDGDLPVPPDGALLRAASHVAFSAPGLAGFTGIDDAAAGLLTAGAQTDAWCCVTCGPHGTLVVDDGRIETVPAFRVPVADTLGAGDVWHGALALSLAAGLPVDRAVVVASAAAALKVRNGKGRDGAPTRDELDYFLARHEPEATT